MSLSPVGLDLTGLGYGVVGLFVLVWLVAIYAARFDAGRRPRSKDHHAAIPGVRSGLQTLCRDVGSRL